MTNVEKTILDKFKTLLAARVSVYKLILFGSRARGDAAPSSDWTSSSSWRARPPRGSSIW
jgi:predicted nucleotidyltransferase